MSTANAHRLFPSLLWDTSCTDHHPKERTERYLTGPPQSGGFCSGGSVPEHATYSTGLIEEGPGEYNLTVVEKNHDIDHSTMTFFNQGSYDHVLKKCGVFDLFSSFSVVQISLGVSLIKLSGMSCSVVPFCFEFYNVSVILKTQLLLSSIHIAQCQGTAHVKGIHCLEGQCTMNCWARFLLFS